MQTAVVEERGGYKLAESYNHGIAFYGLGAVYAPRSFWVNDEISHNLSISSDQ